MTSIPLLHSLLFSIAFWVDVALFLLMTVATIVTPFDMLAQMKRRRPDSLEVVWLLVIPGAVVSRFADGTESGRSLHVVLQVIFGLGSIALSPYGLNGISLTPQAYRSIIAVVFVLSCLHLVWHIHVRNLSIDNLKR
jgi:hypothetical protein